MFTTFNSCAICQCLDVKFLDFKVYRIWDFVCLCLIWFVWMQCCVVRVISWIKKLIVDCLIFSCVISFTLLHLMRFSFKYFPLRISVLLSFLHHPDFLSLFWIWFSDSFFLECWSLRWDSSDWSGWILQFNQLLRLVPVLSLFVLM